MILFDSKQWINDIDTTLKYLPELEIIAGKSVIVTGATGLIGSAVVELLLRYNDSHDKKINIYAAGRNKDKFLLKFGYLAERKDLIFIYYNALDFKVDFNFEADYIIHIASNAYPEIIMKEPAETMVDNFIGLKALLDYSKENNIKRLLYLSSSEVYGKKENNKPFNEDEYGFIDVLNPRNSYSIGKRAGETLCVSYNSEYRIDTVIARPGHIYGPTASMSDNRISSAFAYKAAKGEDLIMKSSGEQIRSYCYCLDCASAIIKIMLLGISGKAYNISNPSSVISIKQMAEIYSSCGGVKLSFEEASQEEKKAFNPMNNSSLNSESLLNLGWRGLFDAKSGLNHTVLILKEVLDNNQ